MGFSIITIFEIGQYILQTIYQKMQATMMSEILCSKCCQKESNNSKKVELDKQEDDSILKSPVVEL